MDNPMDNENGPTVTKWCNHHCHLPPTSFPKFNDSVTMYLFPQSLSKSHFLPSPPSPPYTKLPLSFISNYLLPIYTACCSSNSFSTLEPKWSTWDKRWISLCFSFSLCLSHHHRHHQLKSFLLASHYSEGFIMWMTRTCIFWTLSISLHKICLHYIKFAYVSSFYMKYSFPSFLS